MACFLMATSHSLNQCWLPINEGLWHSPEINFTVSEKASILYNEFEINTLEITATFLRDQRVEWAWITCPSSSWSWSSLSSFQTDQILYHLRKLVSISVFMPTTVLRGYVQKYQSKVKLKLRDCSWMGVCCWHQLPSVLSRPAARQHTRELMSTTHTHPWLIPIIIWY